MKELKERDTYVKKEGTAITEPDEQGVDDVDEEDSTHNQ
jgi:hypothetical protein